jgi:putative ABC transport system ATP-binding protein
MIKIRNLVRHYDAGMVHALNSVSLDISKGEICSIMGPSGCGKSTLLNMIGALDKPTSGEIIIKDQPLESIPVNMYRNRMAGFVFQMHNLLPNITLAENVELPLMARKDIKPRQSFEMAMEILTEFGLEHRASFFPVKVCLGWSWWHRFY